MGVKFKKEGDWADGQQFDLDAVQPALGNSVGNFLPSTGGNATDYGGGGFNPYFANIPQGMDSGAAAFDMYAQQDMENQMGGSSPVVQNSVQNVFDNRDNNNSRYTPVSQEDTEGMFTFEDFVTDLDTGGAVNDSVNQEAVAGSAGNDAESTRTAAEIYDDPNLTYQERVDLISDSYGEEGQEYILERENQNQSTVSGMSDDYGDFPIDVLTQILVTMGESGNQDAIDILNRSQLPDPNNEGDANQNQTNGGNQTNNENVGDDQQNTNGNIIIGGDGNPDGQPPSDDDPDENVNVVFPSSDDPPGTDPSDDTPDEETTNIVIPGSDDPPGDDPSDDTPDEETTNIVIPGSDDPPGDDPSDDTPSDDGVIVLPGGDTNIGDDVTDPDDDPNNPDIVVLDDGSLDTTQTDDDIGDDTPEDNPDIVIGPGGEPSVPPEVTIPAIAIGGNMGFGDFESSTSVYNEADQELRKRSMNLLGSQAPTQTLMQRYNQGMTPYTNDRFTGLNADQVAANQMLRNNINAIEDPMGILSGVYNDSVAASRGVKPITANTIQGNLISPETIQSEGRKRIQDIVAQQFAGTNLAPYTNPYDQQVVDAALQDIERARQLQLQDNASRATLAGAYGGDRAALIDAETNRAALDTAARTAASLRQQGFNDAADRVEADANRAMAAAQSNQSADAQTVRDALSIASDNLQANMSQQRAADTDTQLNQIRQSQALLDAFGQGSDVYRQYLADYVGLGDTLDQRAQRELDFDYDQFLLGQDFDQQQITNLLNLVSRSPQNTKSSTTTDAGVEGDLAALTQIADLAGILGSNIGAAAKDPEQYLRDLLGL